MPPDPSHQAYRSCGRSHSFPEAEAEAVATKYAYSSAAGEGVVSGSRNQRVAGEKADGRWAAVAATAPSVQLAAGA